MYDHQRTFIVLHKDIIKSQHNPERKTTAQIEKIVETAIRGHFKCHKNPGITLSRRKTTGIT